MVEVINRNENSEKRQYAAEVFDWLQKLKINSLVGMGGFFLLPFLYDAYNFFFYGAMILLFGYQIWIYTSTIKKQKYLVEKYNI